MGTASEVRPADRFAWRFLLPAVAAVAGSFVVAVPWLVWTLDQDRISTVVGRLEGEAHEAGAVLPWSAGADLDGASAKLADRLGARITVIAPDGTVLGESTPHPAPLENHANRPEVQATLATGRGHAVRWSRTLDRRLLYAAWLDQRDDEQRIIRMAVPIGSSSEHLVQLRTPFAIALATAGALGLAVAWLASRAMRRRVARMIRFAAALATGAPPPPMAAEEHDELGVLESQLAEMARNIHETLGTMRVQRERLEAILRGMVEGVLVTDLSSRIVLLNARARELLGVPPSLDVSGRPLIELVRDPGLAAIPRQLAAGEPVVSRDIALEVGGTSRWLQVNGAPLTAEHGELFGLVLVLHDVSELRRLETVRQDFVANVSHELRTPLTAIKGYAETLLGPAGEQRATSIRFLEVIDRHSERLGRLIDDLLTLTDLEFGHMPLTLRAIAVGPAIEDVAQMLDDRAARHRLTITITVAPDVPLVEADADRVRQVLLNLLDNAVKFTPEGGQVSVGARPAMLSGVAAVELSVADTGIGIPSHDLTRLTERFFRVDKARSRELGGTGLGLAIVKHIVQRHGGRLTIESTLGRGTVARVVLPAAPHCVE